MFSSKTVNLNGVEISGDRPISPRKQRLLSELGLTATQVNGVVTLTGAGNAISFGPAQREKIDMYLQEKRDEEMAQSQEKRDEEMAQSNVLDALVKNLQKVEEDFVRETGRNLVVPPEKLFSLLAEGKDQEALTMLQNSPDIDISVPHVGEKRTLLDYARDYGCLLTRAYLVQKALQEPEEEIFSLLAQRNDNQAYQYIEKHPAVNTEAKHAGDNQTLLMYAQTYGCNKTKELLDKTQQRQNKVLFK